MKFFVVTSGALLLSVGLFSCDKGGGDASDAPSGDGDGDGVPVCERLFGTPSMNTGLTLEQCSPVCAECESEGFSAVEYSAEEITTLRARVLQEPPALLGQNPYEHPEDYAEEPEKVCGLFFEGEEEYRLVTFESALLAEEAGAQVTHEGACGACSSLQDLAVYIEESDLTTPVRRCGIQNLSGSVDVLAECISALGFTDACSEIWAYNTLNTREVCFDECISALEDPYHLPDGSPNACIQCDEDNSGPVFKAVSGRTRRNSGLPTALCRPCEGVARLEHRYEL